MNIIDSRGTIRKLPPFGRTVLKHQHDYPNVFIYGGEDAWRRATSRQQHPSLSMPLIGDPSDYRWPVKGLYITVAWSEATRDNLDGLAIQLLVNGAEAVCALRKDDPEGFISYRTAL
jgi:hypothetical protein